ncbi:MAG TPA: tripartite tricarboxylate transporter TctB family protein, partial [Rubrivivax sp.]|nr:tripartite tricarboxylate transporter TctB family protein [Rubrivivax sp.]
MSEQQAAGDDSGIPVARDSTVDAVSAVLVMAIGAVVVWEARRLGAGWSSDGPGSGYFPFYIGLILLFGGLGILVQSL